MIFLFSNSLSLPCYSEDGMVGSEAVHIYKESSGGDSLEFISCEPPMPGVIKTRKIIQVHYRYVLSSVSRGGTYTNLYYKGKELGPNDYNGASGQFSSGSGKAFDEIQFLRPAVADEIRITMSRADDWSLLKYHFFKSDRTILTLSVKLDIQGKE